MYRYYSVDNTIYCVLAVSENRSRNPIIGTYEGELHYIKKVSLQFF